MNVNTTEFTNIVVSINGIITIFTLLFTKLYHERGVKKIRSIEFISNTHKLCVIALIPCVLLIEMWIIPRMNSHMVDGINISDDRINIILIISFNFIINVLAIAYQSIYLDQKIIKLKKFIKHKSEWKIIDNKKSNIIYNIMLIICLIVFFIIFWLCVFENIELHLMEKFIEKLTIVWGIYILFLYVKFIINFELPMLVPKKVLCCEDDNFNCSYNMVLDDNCYIKDKDGIILICCNDSNFTAMVKKEIIKEYRVEYRIFIPAKITKNEVAFLFRKVKKCLTIER